MRTFALFLLLNAACTVVCQASDVKSPIAASDTLQFFEFSPTLDLRIDLVAAEPEVVDPVAVAFDENGRMFVVEMRDYPNGPVAGAEPLSQIKLLEDLDGDGRYETSHLFADKLLFATGIMPWEGGVIVTLAGEVRYLKDGDGDHRVGSSPADTDEVWFEGFSEGNPQLRANHPTLGPDGWIYIANGLRGGKVRTVRPGWPKAEIDLRDHDFRFDPFTGVAEAVTGGSQFGLTFDALGNRFICSNRNPCDHVVLETWDLSRNPHIAIGKPIQVVAPAGNDSQVFPAVEAWTTSTLHSGQFTAACGVQIFDGDGLPQECFGNVFTCEPTGSLIHREVIEPQGGTFKSHAGEQNAEFLASRDPWFRPVNLTVGPDGALYVVDMYRAVIEHPEWMPEELKTRRDLRWGDDRGRIYRVAAENKSKSKLPTIATDDVLELVEKIDDENGWTRETAFRLLIEKLNGDSSEPSETAKRAESLLELARRGTTSPGRLLAGSLLLKTSSPEALIAASNLLDASDSKLQAAAIRLLGELKRKNPHSAQSSEEKRLFAALDVQLIALAGSSDASVRFEVARQLGEVQTAQTDHPTQPQEITRALASIAVNDAESYWTRVAVLTSAQDPLALYDEIVTLDADGSVPFLVELAKLIGRRRNESELAGLLARLSSTGPESGWALPILIGLGEGLGNNLELALKNAEPQVVERLDSVFQWAGAIAADSQTLTQQRTTAVGIVALAPREIAIGQLLELATVPDPEIRRVAIQSVGRFRSDERIAPALLSDFEAQPPSVKNSIIDALFADSARIPNLLSAVEAGTVSAAALGPTRIASLTKHPDSSVRAQAAVLFAPPADRQRVIEEYRKALSLEADAQQGREIFQKNCATCHRIGEIGIQVGPDIADSRVRTPDALLTDILDPNRAIDGRYVAYTVVLNDGTVQTGLIESETSSAVTLAQPEGKQLTILRDEIEEMHSDGNSLMPVGIERTISPEEMSDLIAFIKNWRYLDGKVPLSR